MSLRYRTAIKAISSQRGQLSPFMFGLLMGMSVFSMASLKWAQQEMAEQKKRNAALQEASAQDLSKALEFATLTETEGTYSDDFTLERARAYTTRTSGQTRGGQDYLVVARGSGRTALGKESQVIAITGSDDTLRRSDVYRTLDADRLQKLAGDNKTDGVVTFETSAVRTRQVTKSSQNMAAMGEQIYAFFAAHMRMPTGEEYDQLAEKLTIRDVWNRKFDYSYLDTERARLEFTTPWGYTVPLNLNLK
ncbi:MAG: hypothetical protein COY40_01270 [Alphaproteobacteria bacterium CG_4_10_14_0_8_um_filter_53_9]|nr:MAG: hypothetical protein COY40_01270 [Alphaproteobacteria bacterium CG_4_10_14_0_8_um_filter_53_9]